MSRWVKPDFTKEVLGLPGAENPDIAKIAANHGRVRKMWKEGE